MADPLHDGERVLVTGASGRVACVLRPGLRARWALRLVDRIRVPDAGDREEPVEADIRDPEAMASAARGCAAVVHLAAIPTEAPNDELLDINARGTFSVLQAAVRSGCRRFVFASTNHVTGYYPTTTTVRPEMPVRPDGLYAASKVYGEALCRLAHDQDGLEVAVLRIGSPLPAPTKPRHAHTWLSERDLIELVSCCLAAPAYGYVVVYGSSANKDSYWDDAPERRRLGFVPLDDASRMVASGPPERDQSGRHGQIPPSTRGEHDRFHH